nr:unnamed protein product [Digitaria exilis]
MAAPVRGLPLPPSLSYSRTSPRGLAPSARGRSSRSGRRVHGVRAAALEAAEGASRATEPVEVVGVGSRKDAVLDFCLGSRTLSSTPIRFWTVNVMNNSRVQLIQKGHGTGTVSSLMQFSETWNRPYIFIPVHLLLFLFVHFSSFFLKPCIVLVLFGIRPLNNVNVSSAGQDADHISAMELLSAVKSAGNLAASIFLKPFCFEGQRRQVEAADLIGKLQTCSNFHIVIEADSLLETEVETLAEALDSANNAVLSTISMISIMMSGYNKMFSSSLDVQIKEIDPEEVAKDLNNVVFLSLTTARVLSETDMISILHIFRRVTGFTKDIIFSRNSEPDLEPKLIVVSLLTIRNHYDENVATVQEGFLSSLALHFPFISSLKRGDIPEQKQAGQKHSLNQLPDNGSNTVEQELSQLSNGSSDATVSKMFPEENEDLESERENNDSNRSMKPESLESDFVVAEGMRKGGNREHLGSEQEHSFLSNSPGFRIAQLWANERTMASGSSKNDELDIITLPVGVKLSKVQSHHSPNTQPETTHSGTTVLALEYHFLMFVWRKEPEKTWSPIVEIRYGGGTYRGRCQEGVPEGKGRLTFSDGSFYDGLWRFGKRSGLGTLFYSNGDVYHGTWRDDLIHGKGWYYFHSGDRWFANFWKGKANGEGRFYAKDGSIFFGHFQNGWRHGESLLVDANGTRWIEVWDEGVLVGRAKMEK